MPKTKFTPFLLLVPCGVMLCALNVAAVTFAQEVASPLPQMVEETVVAQPALLDQLRANTMTAEQAWDKKLLDEKSALALLEGGLGSTEGDDEDQRLRAQLASVLLKYAPQSLEPLDKKSLRLKRAVADYYASVNDKRAVALHEGLAARYEYSAYEKGSLLRTLGRFQSSLGESQAAIATFVRAHDWFVQAQQKHSVGEMLILAAREYARTGDEKKAQLLYAQVAQVSDGWMSGMALFRQAEPLLEQKKFLEARKFLVQQVPGATRGRRRSG